MSVGKDGAIAQFSRIYILILADGSAAVGKLFINKALIPGKAISWLSKTCVN